MKITGYYRYALLVALAGSIHLFATAQKLPEKQEVSFRAPDNIKIDGKTTEWSDQFQAYNSVSRVFYTVSNDDKNLYLTIRMGDYWGNEKVINGGITFTIKPSIETGNKSKDVRDISITFPSIENKYNLQLEDFARNSSHYEALKSDTVDTMTNKKKIELLIARSNQQLGEMFKGVQVTGIKDITEPLISVYNTEGIRVAAQYNNEMKYIYEMALPLKYLGTSINNKDKFRYNIKLNARPTRILSGTIIGMPVATNLSNVKPNVLYVNYPTDFWGEYKLAEK